MKIGIIDYGCGNVGSVQNMFSKVDVWSELVSNPLSLNEYDALVLPGVGSFDTGVKKLKETGFWEVLSETVDKGKKPILGICLGMQLMFEGSEEGNERGFGWFEGKCQKFDVETVKRIPNIGWNELEPIEENGKYYFPKKELVFYFVHSFHAPKNMEVKNVLATSNYNFDFPAAIEKNNITGFQFHPEKSLKNGMDLLKKWVNKIGNEK